MFKRGNQEDNPAMGFGELEDKWKVLKQQRNTRKSGYYRLEEL